MYLKQIKICGFKSFADKTIIDLDKGISGVVGPNGSGKSNIVDAVRWVLGEQSVKSLRGDGSMQDVIFAGSKTKNSSSLASVILIFDNEDKYLDLDYTEVEVKRTLYKTGESEYFLNNSKCRLKDITDLFSDTGVSKESFNIISQGDIGAILSDKPEDRRVIFEAAAGVLKYKKRKDEAIRKLDRTKSNVERITDIINELKINVEPLKKQSKDAKEYLDCKEKLDKMEVALVVNDIEKLNYNFQLDKKRASDLKEELLSVEINTNVDNATLEKLKLKETIITDEIYLLQRELVALSSNAEKLSGQKNLIVERQKYQSSDIKIHENVINLKEKLLKLDNEYYIFLKELELVNEDKKLNTKSIDSINNILKEIKKDHDNNIVSLTNINRLERDLSHKVDLLNNSIENSSFLPFSVKRIIDNPKIPGVHGTIAKLIEVEEKNSIAISTALGAASNFIVIDDEECAREAIKYLKTNSYGRATFFPINIIKERQIDSESYKILREDEDFIGDASSLVKYNSTYDNIIKNQLGTTVVVTNLNAGIRISKLINNRYKIVTLDGQIIHVGGSLTGGNITNKTNYILEKYELKNISKKLKTINEEKQNIEFKINEIDTKYELENNKLQSLLSEKTQIDSNIRIKSEKLEQIKEFKKSVSDEIGCISNKDNISKEEENILNEFYNVENKKQNKEIEINQAYKTSKEIKEEIIELESTSKYKNSDYNKKQIFLKDLEISINRADVQLDNLLNILTAEYSITYEKAKANYILDEDEEETRKIVQQSRAKIKKLGNVNLGAIEEYSRVSVRYDFLLKQKEDLNNAQDTILNIIGELDEIMKVKFEKSFKEIQEKFIEVYKGLFNGGDAELSLVNPDDVLLTGIQIKALPPGKSFQHLSLLSGGEKALTAIALLFAILQTRPVPFCILDEVEAALDEVNVVSFGKLLERLKKATQFIVITHKKKTMEFADTLYGVTMQETGVSKLVSVKLD